MNDLTLMAREERLDFVDFLEQLSPDQWDHETLCPDWRVHDVVAHVFSYEDSRADLA